MKRINLLYFLINTVLVLFFSVVTNGQIVFRRIPTGTVVAQPTPQQQGPVAQNNVPTERVVARPSRSDQRAQEAGPFERVVAKPQTPDLPDMQYPRLSPPYIFASPTNVVVKWGESFGYTGIVWDGGPDHPYAEIWRSVDGGAPEFVIEKGKGQTGSSIEPGRTYTFILTDFGKTISEVTVTGTRDVKNSPIGIFNRPGRDVEANMSTYVTDVGTVAESKTVDVTFFAASNANPIVEVGTARPIQSNGRWIFPEGKLVGSGSATPSGMKKVGTKINTFHKFSSLVPGFPELQQSTVYWYIINVRNPEFQTTGQFSTGATPIGVRVVFEKIKIIDDSDELSEGEIDVWMWVNRGEAGEQGERTGRRGMSSGETYDLGKEFIIKNAPTTLTISVSADDDDCVVGCFDLESVSGPINGWYNNKNGFDGAGISDQWDLIKFPTFKNEVYRNAFKLRSPGGNAKLQFEVTGYWEIMRGN